jgi:hypothetical protein
MSVEFLLLVRHDPVKRINKPNEHGQGGRLLKVDRLCNELVQVKNTTMSEAQQRPQSNHVLDVIDSRRVKGRHSLLSQ